MSGPSPRALLALLLVAALVSSAHPAAAQEDLPVQIKADFFRYDRRTRVLTATGHVVLVFEDVRIEAEAVVANLETGDLTAEGRVRFEVRGNAVAAEQLTYNLQTRLGELRDARADYTGPLVLGAVHLRAQRLSGRPGETATIRGGFLTTCDEQDPVVHLTADEVTIYLNDRIVGRRVSLWIAGRKVFTWPYFQIFLRERRQSRLTPAVGYSDAEGWFVKTTYSYVVNERHYGFLYGDWMERLGIGTGIEHVYRIRGGEGSLFVYRLANRQTDGVDLRSVFTHTQRFSPNFGAFLYADYAENELPGITPSNLFGAVDVFYATPRSQSFLFATGSRFSPGSSSLLTGLLGHSQSFGAGLAGQVYLNWRRVTGPLGIDDEAQPRVVLDYSRGTVNASLVAETRWDLDGGRFPFDDQYSLDRLPELTLSLRPFRLGDSLLVLQVQGGLARFRESTVGPGGGTLDASRADTMLTLSGPIPLGDGVAGLRAFVRGSLYSTGAGRLFYGGRVEYTQRLGQGVTARLGYTGQATAGVSPFLFDQISGVLSVGDAELTVTGVNVLARAGVHYDLVAGRWGDVLAEAIYNPRPGWNVGLAGAYDPQVGRVRRIEGVVDLQLSKEWRVEYIGTYDGATGRFVHDRVAVTRVFCDCLAVTLSYLGTRGEIWLEGWLTALPWARGLLGIGQRGTLLFDLPPVVP